MTPMPIISFELSDEEQRHLQGPFGAAFLAGFRRKAAESYASPVCVELTHGGSVVATLELTQAELTEAAERVGERVEAGLVDFSTLWAAHDSERLKP